MNSKDEAAILDKNYFAKGKLLYNWRKLFFTDCFCQQNKKFEDRMFSLNIKFDQLIKTKIKQGQKIILGSLANIPGKSQKFNICDIVNSKLCKFHFTITMSPNLFGLVWAKCLKSKLGAAAIKLKIARFVGFRELEIEDVSDLHYQSFLQTKVDQKQLIFKRKQKFCFEENNDFKKTYLTFSIKPLKNKIDVKGIIKKRLFILGTNRDQIINEQIYNLLENPETLDKSILYCELQELNLKKKDAMLVKTNSSFIQILLFPDCDSYGFGNYLNLDYQLEIQKYESILKKIFYENGNWQISMKDLMQEIERKKKISLTNCRIVTISNQGAQDIEISCSKNE